MLSMMIKIKRFLKRVRWDCRKIPTKKFILLCFLFLLFGAAMGVVSKLEDFYWSGVLDITSRMGIWIFLGVVICSFTKSSVRAAAYEFIFCAGMIVAYYSTAMIGGFYYSKPFITYWSVFTLFTPVFSFFAWYARGRGAFSWVMRIGILLAMFVFAFIFGAGISDIVFAVLIILVTLKKPNEVRDEY